jgi:hypothetical protein
MNMRVSFMFTALLFDRMLMMQRQAGNQFAEFMTIIDEVERY